MRLWLKRNSRRVSHSVLTALKTIIVTNKSKKQIKFKNVYTLSLSWDGWQNDTDVGSMWLLTFVCLTWIRFLYAIIIFVIVIEFRIHLQVIKKNNFLPQLDFYYSNFFCDLRFNKKNYKEVIYNKMLSKLNRFLSIVWYLKASSKTTNCIGVIIRSSIRSPVQSKTN